MRGSPSAYLEERMEAARSAASGVHREIDEMERRAKDLRGTIVRIERELDQAVRELVFVRSSYGGESVPSEPPQPPRSPGVPSFDPAREGRGRSAASAASLSSFTSGEAIGGRFVRFTVSAYNRTVDDIKRRRGVLAMFTVALSAAVGLTIAILTVVYASASSPLWVAILPVVWLVPVPFFLIAFRGTHRVLRQNHLKLPGET
ncbi:MAG: hypothetical protein L3J95_03060 [Thermoplasmata archaeon]|nr:hypothetical protein [Thermoplasmata archaeon]MCI4359386.1 hypothetical protein [Thermoplasmata archaeon]